jgi:hypothetical protein
MGADHVGLFEGIRPIGDAVAALPVESAVLDGEANRYAIGRSMRFRGAELTGKQRRSWSDMTSWPPMGRTCALSPWRSAGRD